MQRIKVCEARPERPAASTNAVVFWNAVADNSIVVVGGNRERESTEVLRIDERLDRRARAGSR
jgi:hypothetical protein